MMAFRFMRDQKRAYDSVLDVVLVGKETWLLPKPHNINAEFRRHSLINFIESVPEKTHLYIFDTSDTGDKERVDKWRIKGFENVLVLSA